ncbi:MAG: hypothetical protein JKY11_01045 [Alphaproteobacteria bacterium]|nr:hypothetical protein [Alphaproteobacteria bacterium]
MNFCKKYGLLLVSTALLGGCLTTPQTVLPTLTFNQYASSPIYFQNVKYMDIMRGTSENDTEALFRDSVTTYFSRRFQSNGLYKNQLKITPVKLETEKSYLKVGGDRDMLSPWKSYDRYRFVSELELEMICDQTGDIWKDSVKISKITKVPGHYSPYKRDIHMMGFLEGYISDIDTAILNTMTHKC